MPKMGISLTAKSGSSTRASSRSGELSMIDALFSSTQKRVLALLFGHPERSFFATEVIALAGSGSGAVQRELKKLEISGLARVSRVGTQKHYQANTSSPIFAELCGLFQKTIGLVDPIREALLTRKGAIKLAFIYGSVAKAKDGAESDVDLLIVSELLTLENVYKLLAPVERVLQRKINPSLYTQSEFDRRFKNGNAFLKRVMATKIIVLIGAHPLER